MTTNDVPNVLIVDDSLTVRMDLAEAFTHAGFRSFPCASAKEAREALRNTRMSLAVLDVLLPDGDGFELLQEMRAAEATATIPILMLSSAAEVKDRIRGLQTGANDYVGKPYDVGFVLARARELIQSSKKPPRSWERARVLVIDDSTTFREALRHALSEAGYEVLVAASGEEGLRLAAAQRPNAIIVDGVMPGIDGTTVIRKIRLDAALRATPCILLTAADDLGAEPRALDAGADAFVRKEDELDVILARLAAALRTAQTPSKVGESLAGPKRILAVDDSPTYLQELAAILREDSYDVVLARSGEEAIDMLSVQAVDCILLDLLMPGLGGTETCRRIKASPGIRDVPLIMLTALEDRGAMIEGLSTGADDYISKSSEFDVLRARVRAQIRRKQFEDENRRIREDLLRSELQAADARAARKLAETRAALADELERKNRELEAFSYSVSHDLRAPLRTIDGFSLALFEDHAGQLDAAGREHLTRIRNAAARMSELIEALLTLSRITSAGLRRERVDLSDLARAVCDELARRDPRPTLTLQIEVGLVADADAQLIRVLLENLIGNAWKFTAKTAEPKIGFGSLEHEGGVAYFVRDNGAGFDMAYAARLFTPFQRLHRDADFPGTGVGLATVYRIIDRHGGRVWAEGAANEGATFFFTLPPTASRGRTALN